MHNADAESPFCGVMLNADRTSIFMRWTHVELVRSSDEARDDGAAVESAEPYANYLHLTSDR